MTEAKLSQESIGKVLKIYRRRGGANSHEYLVSIEGRPYKYWVFDDEIEDRSLVKMFESGLDGQHDVKRRKQAESLPGIPAISRRKKHAKEVDLSSDAKIQGGRKLRSILGMLTNYPERTFLVQFSDFSQEVVPGAYVRENAPSLLIAFYENHMRLLYY